MEIEYRCVLNEFTGQWCVVQDTLEAATIDPQTEANGYVYDCAGYFEFRVKPVQSKPKEPKDLIGEASVAALEDAGYKVVKK